MDTREIGKKIAEARKKMNLSQAQLAEQMFISPQAVGKWERGESMPDLYNFVRLTGILRLDVNEFFELYKSQNGGLEPSKKMDIPFGQVPTHTEDKRLNWNMSRGNWVDADFSGLTNLHNKFSSSNMQRCKFIGSDLSGLLLKGNNISACDFSGADFRDSKIEKSNLSGNSFNDSSLIETEFTGSYLTDNDCNNTDFSGVTFREGGFEKNRIAKATWKHTTFIDTYLGDIVFEGSIEDCSFDNCAFQRVKFENAILKEVFFKCKSLKKIQFINCKVDKLTYAFLSNGKATMTDITLLTE